MDALDSLINRLREHKDRGFKQNPLLIASPGRVNLIGEHTDYNGGYALPAAIDKYIVCGFATNDLNHCRISALDMNESFDLELDIMQKADEGSWKNYVVGVIHGIQAAGKKLKNFDLAFCGNIPIGAGLSSSAALENGVASGINELFNLGLTRQDIVEISVKAEHDFAGVQCGMMDQFANMNGRKGHALLIDFSDMSSLDIPLDLEGLCLVLINSNVNHQLSDSPYNERKQQCIDGLQILRKKYPELTSLSDSTIALLDEVRAEMPKLVYNRCKFVIEENARVIHAAEAVKQNDWPSMGKDLLASHAGLRNLYEVSCEELDFLVAEASNFNGVLGSRMMGGGFGGCTINLVEEKHAPAFEEHMTKAFNLQFDHEASIIPIKISAGTQVIEA